ncbi:MAG: hypothetical protein Q7U14_13055, partial [Lacisediminimonas sp.]|nr:hypothetical protein [Lacisediminimonas sp.]
GVVSVAAAANVTLNDVNSITLGNVNASANLVVVAGGGITGNGALIIGGSTSLSAGASSDVALTGANDFSGAASTVRARHVTPNDVNGLNLGASSIGGSLSVTAGGNLVDSGVLLVAGSTSLTVGSNDITLDNANDFGGALSVASARDLRINDINALDLGAVTLSRNLNVSTQGALTDSGALRITGTSSLTVGAGNDITLDNANDFVGAVGIVSGRNVRLNDINALDLGAGVISGALTVTTQGALTDSGALRISGGTSLSVGAGNDITLDLANDFGGSLSIASVRHAVLNDINGIDFGATTVSGNLGVNAAGALTDSGSITVAGATSLLAGTTNDITLDSANDFAGALGVVSARDVRINDINALGFGNVTASG